MNKMSKRLLSLLLAVILTVQLLPVQVFAEENSDAELAAEPVTSTELTIVDEMEELREESGKHFRMSDGSFLAVSYGVPVHYLRDDGTWAEIDNRFRQENSRYAVENADSALAFASKLQGGELFTASYGERSVGFSLLDTREALELIDKTEKAGRLSADALGTAAEKVGADEKDDAGKVAYLSFNRRAKAEPVAQAVKPLIGKTGWTTEDLLPTSYQSSLRYNQVYPGVDLVYTAYGYSVKEKIVLHGAQECTRYDFLLTLDGLTAELNENGSVSLRDGQGTEVYWIPAPYMQDEGGAVSTAVYYTLTETEAGTVLSVNADEAWINDAERVYPVTIDPTLQQTCGKVYQDIVTCYTMEYEPNSNTRGHSAMYAGSYNHGSNKGRYHLYMYFQQLPTIPDSAVVVDANLNLYERSYSQRNCATLPLAIYPVAGAKPSSYDSYYDWYLYITWNKQPSYDKNDMVDYTKVTSSKKYWTWDLTRLIRKWYTEGTENRSVVMLQTDEDAINELYFGCASFSAYGESSPPILTVSYRYAVGLEDYYTYRSHSIDRAGTGYIGDFNGHLTLVETDASAASTAMPFSLSHVYNSAYVSGQVKSMPGGAGYGSMHAGVGWKLDLQQTVTVYDANYLQYLDGDGSVHYFYKTGTNTYQDEDGLGLTITASGTNYKMTDKKDNIRYFTNGLLSYIQDANGNKITYNRDEANRVTTVVRKTSVGKSETVATLSYNDSNYLTSIKDLAGNTTSYTYSSKRLTKITRANGATVSYTYDSKGRLLSATDNESKYAVKYTYDSEGRISGYAEYGNGILGASVSVSGTIGTREYRDSGKDRVLGTKASGDDRISSYVFDYFGRTVSSSTMSADRKIIYGAAGATYTTNSGTSGSNNRISVGSSAGMRPVGGVENKYSFVNENLLGNGDMSGSSKWSGGSYVSTGDATFSRAIKLTGAAGEKRSVSQTVTVNDSKGQTYLFSAWAKANSVALKEDDRSFALTATLTYTNGTTETQRVSYCADSTEWQYAVLPVVPKKSLGISTVKVALEYNNNANSVLFTYACLTRESAASYKWDPEGNLVSVAQPGNATESYSYEGADLMTQVTKGNGTYSYVYDAKHNVKSVTNDGVKMELTYDGSGNTTGSTLTGGSTKILTAAAYDSNGNLLATQTDARGNATTYTYGTAISKAIGQPTKVTDANGTAVTTGYTATTGRTSYVTGSGVTVGYTYGTGRLTGLTRTANGKEQAYVLKYDGFGNRKTVQVAGKTLVSYEYGEDNAENNRPLSKMIYGNGATVSYTYDNLERVTQAKYPTGTVKYVYTGEGYPGSVTDGVGGRSYAYTYDSLGRLLSMTETAGDKRVQDYSAAYDTANRLTKVTYHISPAWDGAMGQTRTYTYSYNSADGSLSSLKAPGGTMSYSYDKLKRLTSRTVATSSADIYTRKYSYLAGSGGTTLLVSKLDYGDLGSYTYAYDKVGNISKVTGSSAGTYTYDGLGQLLTATQDGVKYSYTYDGAGNLLTKTAGTKTDTYSYDGTWLDKLTAYNGKSIEYDDIGNPTTWYDGKTFTWANGRSLASARATGLNATYKYNADGLRLSKIVNGAEHNYIWQGGRLIADVYNGKATQFFYDESGKPMCMLYNGNYYYYITNLQGDVMKLINTSGTVKAEYTYDPWGKVLTATGTLAEINPLRYRGYFYDAETGFYYCKGRYYDPEIGRFINADGYVSTGQGFIGLNMFAYCGNNPTNYLDSTGTRMTAYEMLDGYYSPQTPLNQTWGFINGQELLPYADEKFAKRGTYGKNACGIIAAYNVNQLLGNSTSLGGMAEEFGKRGYYFWWGALGTNPWIYGSYFRSYGYSCKGYRSFKALNADAKEGDKIIFTVMNDKNKISHGLHTMAAQYDGSNYVVYNAYGKASQEYTEASIYDIELNWGWIYGFRIDIG